MRTSHNPEILGRPVTGCSLVMEGLADKGGKEMTEKEEIAGYYTEDGEIYCVECINRNREMMKRIERAVTAEDSEESLHFCEGCKKEIK